MCYKHSFIIDRKTIFTIDEAIVVDKDVLTSIRTKE
jgi:hypothetical protein